jgi:predicted nucleic acid-binding protein
MGLMVDTNVFIIHEKRDKAIDFSSWDSSQKVYISVVVVSELLMGVHRANTEERRQRRSAFVEAVISASLTSPSRRRAFTPRSLPTWPRKGR